MAFVSSEMISLEILGKWLPRFPRLCPLWTSKHTWAHTRGTHLQHIASRDTVISWTARTFKLVIAHDSLAPNVLPVVFRPASGRAGQGRG